jgi:plastocyanin
MPTAAPGAARPTGPDAFGEIFFAAGEEKSQVILPAGYGYPYKAGDRWVINYMLHNLLATPDEVYIAYDLDFIPADAPGAKAMKAAHPIWNDVEKGKNYPVFDVLKGSGHDGVYTYPDDAIDPYKGRIPANQVAVDKDMVLLGMTGHLHPGGLHTDMYLSRPGVTEGANGASVVNGKVHLFRSDAIYYEPAGAVSWDVSTTATPLDWRASVKQGDTISISASYDTKRASWYESMGIMVLWAADAADATGPDPFQAKVDVKGAVTHGHLAENDHHGGGPGKYVDLAKKPSLASDGNVTVADFSYAPGDMSGIYDSVPTVKPGDPLTFVNKDAPLGPGIWHTITACKAPCDQETGVAYPLADSDVIFDSGELGVAGPPTAGRVDWTIPTNLARGTYTYFCRIHPSMRGAFRVEG